MIENNVWIDNIKVGLEDLADPVQGFINYEFGELYTMYQNYLEFVTVFLCDDVDLGGFLDKCSKEKIISEKALAKLKQLNIALNDFYEQTDKLADFEVIRRPEWDTIIPLAQGCLDELTQ